MSPAPRPPAPPLWFLFRQLVLHVADLFTDCRLKRLNSFKLLLVVLRISRQALKDCSGFLLLAC
jgi:hypothetical protein